MRTLSTNFFFLLVGIWILLSFFNIFYNTIKSISEVRDWAFLSDTEKRYKIFGDLYSFIIIVDRNTKDDASILIVSKDKMIYYLARYYIYPKHVYHIDDNKRHDLIEKAKKFDYIASYNKSISPDNYKVIVTFKAKTQENFGKLYKRR